MGKKKTLKNISVYEKDHRMMNAILLLLESSQTQANFFEELLQLHSKYKDAEKYLQKHTTLQKP